MKSISRSSHWETDRFPNPLEGAFLSSRVQRMGNGADQAAEAAHRGVMQTSSGTICC